MVISMNDRCSWMRQWLDGVLGYGIYDYEGKMRFRLPKETCDNLRSVAAKAHSLRTAYIEKCKSGQRRIAGFHRDIQNANITVLREFDRICKARGFVYMLHGGSLIGALRHGGIIPWDDDIDVIMPREQYEQIIDVFNAECGIPCLRAKLISPSRGVVFIKIEAIGEPMISMDIFPFDCYADAFDPALQGRLTEYCHERGLLWKVLPDKNPAATYEYFARLRDSLGLTRVSHDSPECGVVLYHNDHTGGGFIASRNIFPIGGADFEGLTMPVPANPAAALALTYDNYRELPLRIRSHSKPDKSIIDRMLNVQRFLRSDPFRFAAPIPRRADMKERRRDRCITSARSALAPVFNVITRDTLKIYRIFSWKKIFRLRVAKLMRDHLEAIETYGRLIQDEHNFPLAQGALRLSQLAGVDALARVVRVCDSEGMACWLWLGSLLGAIRAGAFRCGDEEAVLLMPRADYERFRPCFNAGSDAGGLRAELVQRYGGLATVVAQEGKSRVVVIPGDACPDDWDRNQYADHMADAANASAIDRLKAENDVEGLYRRYAADRERMGVGLERDASHSLFPAWDCPALFAHSRVLSAKYYSPSAKRMFEGLEAPVPADPDIVLTSLYGDYLYYPEEIHGQHDMALQ